MEDGKQCSKCKQFKSLNKFERDKLAEDGFSAICKECRRKFYIEYLKKKKKTLLEKYSEDIVDKIIGEKLWIGMTTEMARDTFGKPDKVNTAVRSQGVHEEWIYLHYQTCLLFDSGKLSSWHSL